MGCGACEGGCPFGAIKMEGDLPVVKENCTLCGICVNLCSYHAISLERAKIPPDSLGEWKDIMVWGEWEDRGGLKIREVVFELLGKARALSVTTDDRIVVAIAGPVGMEGPSEELFRYGADRVVYLEHELLDRYTTDGYANVLSALIADERPSVMLFGATVNGRDLAPRIAARLGVGLTADCTELTIDDGGELLQTRPAFGGNIMASILTPYTRPQMATVRPRVFKPPIPVNGRGGVVERRAVRLRRSSLRTDIVGSTSEEEGGAMIEEAEVLLSVGRGIASMDNLDMIRELAKELDATVSSSRSLVELGWMPPYLQVGQSGKIVTPRLYLALGISGAVQHLVGMNSSDFIVAINKDPEAPIFKVADLGIVGDVGEIVPVLLKKLRERST